MRVRLILLAALPVMLLLAACDSAPEEALPTLAQPGIEQPPATQAATPQPQAQAEATTAAPDTAEETPDPLVAAGVQMPLPGTMESAPATEDPDASLLFDSIIFQQSGGPNNINLIIEIYGDGRLVRDGVTSSITPEQVTILDNSIKAMNFFGIQGQFAVPGASADTYTYRITVERAGASRMITAQDAHTPLPLRELFALIGGLGQ